MSDTPWTKGPWFAEKLKTRSWVCTKENGSYQTRVAECPQWTHGHPNADTAFANARLISCAPEMAEALRTLCDALPQGDEYSLVTDGPLVPQEAKALVQARALLARIHGDKQ